MRRAIPVLLLVGGVWLTPGNAPRAEDGTEAVLEQVRAATLGPDGAVALRDLDIDLGLGVLEVVEGHLFPASPVAGRSREAVFVGTASFAIEPPDAIEASQLELFTKQESLSVTVDTAVLAIGDPEVSRRLLERPPGEAADEERIATAQETFEAWVSGPERRGFGVDAAIASSALGDSAFRHYFTALMHSDEFGRFYYILDPSQLEQVTLGRFVQLELDDREEYLLDRAIRRAKRRGRYIQTRLEDLGHWDTWLRSSLRDETGRPEPGSTGFEPTHYAIDATLTPKEHRIDATVVLDLEARVSGRRTITLELFDDLKPEAVRDGEGRDLVWFRSGSDLHVFLAEPVASGGNVQIEVAYGGVAFDEFEPGVFPLSDTFAWYPRVGTIDRATYEATLRYPKKHELLASGRLVSRRVESGQQIEERVLDLPSFAFSFEVGSFDIVEERVGHVDLTVGFAKTTLVMDKGAKADVLETLQQALLFYEESFGAYPLDHLTVATVPRGFSQGFAGFLTLSHYLLALPKNLWVVKRMDGLDNRHENRMETVSHELAHQWWGNKVGWESYRDQWLSEALADYSSVIFTRNRAERRSVYLARHARSWKRTLRRTAGEGRLVESLGPVVLGERLLSSMSRTAYQAVVYDKGSVVFSMLARAFGEEQFTAMLETLADHVANRVISTETFFKSLEHMTGLDLASFTDHYVYGTGIPEVYYRYRFEKTDDGQWMIEGQARQVPQANYRYTLYRTEAGGWDVSRERADTADVSASAFVVPFQVVLEGSASEPYKRKGAMVASRYQTGRGLGGNVVVEGEHSEFSFRIKERPRELYLDQRGEVLAYFYCESREPKRMLRYRAMELEGEEAEAMYRRALAAPLFSEDTLGRIDARDKDLEKEERLQNARIHLHLTRLYLDQQRDAEARTEFEIAEELFDKGLKNRYRATRGVLASRLETRNGEYKEAWDRLSRSLRLRFPRLRTDTVADAARRDRWRQGRSGDGEDYALLAVTAFETGHDIVARRALEEAEERGADMSALKERIES